MGTSGGVDARALDGDGDHGDGDVAHGPRCVLLTSLEALRSLEQEWREIALERESLLATPEFYKAWVHNHAGELAPYVPVLLDAEGRLEGLLPLTITRDVWRHAQIAGAASFWAHVIPVARPEAEHEVVLACSRLLAERCGEWRRLTIEHAVTDTDWVEILSRTISREAGKKLHEKRIRHPWLFVDVERGWDAYLATRSAKFRHELRRYRRRLLESHEITVRPSTRETELADDVESLLRLHLARRKEADGSTFEDAAMRGVISELASEAFRRSWLRLRLTEVDGETAGGSLCIRIGSRWECHLLGWDPAWAALGLGRTIAMDVAEAAAREGARELDLGVGYSDFKRRIATSQAEVVTVSLYTRSLATLFAVRQGARRILPSRLRRVLGRALRLGEL